MRHPNLADKGDACLVVVDMQQPFLNVMFDRETVVQNVRRLAEAAKILSLPMIATTQNSERMGNTVNEVQEVIGDLIAIDKMSFSCCGSDEFNQAVT
ncbi:MAG TPA: isochorismatase family protein, partial [Armatimonadota bacterium]